MTETQTTQKLSNEFRTEIEFPVIDERWGIIVWQVQVDENSRHATLSMYRSKSYGLHLISQKQISLTGETEATIPSRITEAAHYLANQRLSENGFYPAEKVEGFYYNNGRR